MIGAAVTSYCMPEDVDIGMAGNGAIAALVAITAPSGYVEFWAAPIIGAVAGVIVVVGVLAIDKLLDDPVGALSAHGLAGIWGTLSCGLFTSPRLADYNGVGDPGLFYSGSLDQLGVQAVGCAAASRSCSSFSFATFCAIKKTYRAARERRGGGRRPRHHRARHVRLPRAVHPGAGAGRLRRATTRRPPPAQAGDPSHQEVPA